jgi:flagellar protein FlaG
MNAIENVTTTVEESIVTAPPAAAAKSPSPNMDEKVMQQSPPSTDVTKPETEKKRSEIDKDALKELVDNLREQFRIRNTSLNFSIDEDTESLVVKVIDSDTEKVIRQIPPEEALAFRRRIQELLGVLYDKEG